MSAPARPIPDVAPGRRAVAARPRAARRPRKLGRGALTPWLFLLPFLALFAGFVVAPAVAGVLISFSQWDILGSPAWRGLANYRDLFRDELFGIALRNTFYFMLLTTAPLVVLGLALALLLNQGLRGTRLVRTIVFMPHVMMVSSVAILWSWMYDRAVGLINHHLNLVGVPAVGWLTDSAAAMPALALTTIWWTVNTNMIIYLAALQDIPAELNEAAIIDGAGAWARFRHVTLPLLVPVTALVVAVTFIASWRVFGQAYLMTRGGPETSTVVVVQYIYVTAFQNFEMGPAAAAGVILLLITLTCSLIQLRVMGVR